MRVVFEACCKIINFLSISFHTTYEEMNTYLFIYTQPIIIIISFGIVISILFYKLLKKKSTPIILLLLFFGILGFIYTQITLAVWKRYSVLSAHNTCIKAYKDLDILGEITGMGYVGINLFLFIVLFLFIIVFNFISILLIKKYIKTS